MGNGARNITTRRGARPGDPNNSRTAPLHPRPPRQTACAPTTARLTRHAQRYNRIRPDTHGRTSPKDGTSRPQNSRDQAVRPYKRTPNQNKELTMSRILTFLILLSLITLSLPTAQHLGAGGHDGAVLLRIYRREQQ